MNETVKLFQKIKEPYAAGFFEEPDRSLFFRFSRAQRRYYEDRPVDDYKGGRLYPSGLANWGGYAVQPECAKTFNPATGGKGQVPGFYESLQVKNPKAAEIMLNVREQCNFTIEPSADYVTLSGYTHGSPYFERIIAEGFDSYRNRIDKIQDIDMRDGLLDVLEGIKNYHSRGIDYLKGIKADSELIDALTRVPFKPARNIYEALVAWNFILYLDRLDNLGMIDQGLMPYYQGEDISKELRELFENINDNEGWSCSVGPFYNEISKECLRQVKGLRRPMMGLRVLKDMPDDVWQLALEATYSGSGQPAFYNEEKVQEMLEEMFPEAPKEDLLRFSEVGCTETSLAGMTNTGGIDGNLNLALIFERFMEEQLPKAATFEAFYTGFLEKVAVGVDVLLKDVYENHRRRAIYLPNPMRTLMIDDCIDKGLDYNAKGARYNATLTSESGMINVIDSMLAIKYLIFDKRKYTAEEFLELLSKEDDHFYSILKTCPHYGVDNEENDELAAKFSTFFYDLYKNYECYRGGPCIPSSHQFNRHPKEGAKVGPTPDGRHAGEALGDSIGALSGKSTNGPTAMLLSATKLDQKNIYGIPVLNLSINKKFAQNSLKALLQGYMSLGGVQVQVTLTSKEDLLDALEHPEKHEDLVVRVGGYSEYFNKLTPDLQRVIVERTLHEA